MSSNESWEKIFKDYKVLEHNFDFSPYELKAEEIKKSCQDFKTTGEKEVRILCKQDSREDRPKIFSENNLFILPIRNGIYNIIKGEGYIDIPKINSEVNVYKSKLDFHLETSLIGNSEMQHLDLAYASSLIRTFMKDESLVLTIRGRKYTPEFSFYVGKNLINVSSVQTEVDAGYEGKEQIVLIEAKNFNSTSLIIRQLYYPYRQWQMQSKKPVRTLFFDNDIPNNIYSIWAFEFEKYDDYNSIKLIRSERYKIVE